MGHTSEKPKKEVKKEWPVSGVDYHLVKVMKGEFPPAAYLQRSGYRLSKSDVKYYLTHYKRGEFILVMAQTAEKLRQAWYLVPGPKSNPKWGPICP